MKTLVLSDTHLTHRFNRQQFDYIAKLVNQVDQVVLNGDFWDCYLTTFKLFIDSEWQQLFELLKTKKTIYLYGNHDPAHTMDERVERFSDVQGERYSIQLSSGTEVIIEHGDLITPEFDAQYPRLTRRFHFMYYPYLKMQSRRTVLGKIARALRDRRYRRMLGEVRQYAQSALAADQLLICGHVHMHADERDTNRFICLGPFWNGVARYAIIDEQSVSVFEEPYA